MVILSDMIGWQNICCGRVCLLILNFDFKNVKTITSLFLIFMNSVGNCWFLRRQGMLQYNRLVSISCLLLILWPQKLECLVRNVFVHFGLLLQSCSLSISSGYCEAIVRKFRYFCFHFALLQPKIISNAGCMYIGV